jgi:hypothetical protein
MAAKVMHLPTNRQHPQAKWRHGLSMKIQIHQKKILLSVGQAI